MDEGGPHVGTLVLVMELKLPIKSSVGPQPCSEEPGASCHSPQPPPCALVRPLPRHPLSKCAAKDLRLLFGHRQLDAWKLLSPSSAGSDCDPVTESQCHCLPTACSFPLLNGRVNL